MRMGTGGGWLLGLAIAGCAGDGRETDVARTAQPLVMEQFELLDLGIISDESHGVLRMMDNCMLWPEEGQERIVYFNPARGSASRMHVELRQGFGSDAPIIASGSTESDIIELEFSALSRETLVQLTVWEGSWSATLPWAGGYHRLVGQRRVSRDALGNFVPFEEPFHVVDKPCFPGIGECVPPVPDPDRPCTPGIGECLPPLPPPCRPDPPAP